MNQYFSTNYSNQAMAKALDTFNCWEEHHTNPILCLRGLRYLFKHRHYKPPISQQCYKCPKTELLIRKAQEWFNQFIDENKIEHAREIADIVSTYCSRERNYFLDRLRTLEEKEELTAIGIEREVERERKTVIKTVYSDSQNVHNNKINSSVVSSATELCNKYKEIISLQGTKEQNQNYQNNVLEQIGIILKQNHPDKQKLIIESIDYLHNNSSTFGSQNISMTDVFIAIWAFLVEHIHRKELELRLLEEMKEMNGMCSSGHIARLINVIQGFTDEDSLTIRISDVEQCKAVISQYLTKVLGECKDEKIIDGVLDGNDDFVKFIRKKVAENLLEWQKVYGKKSLQNIAKIVNSYCGTKVFEDKKS